MDIALAVIGGTGVYRLAALEDEQALHCDTPYGAPSGPLRIGHLGNARVAFLAVEGLFLLRVVGVDDDDTWMTLLDDVESTLARLAD